VAGQTFIISNNLDKLVMAGGADTHCVDADGLDLQDWSCTFLTIRAR
jgi:hypothetical protein